MMKGDFSRQTFDPKKHYSSVLMQQGRVQVDADWNEQQAINQYRIETETKDVIGKCGVPKQGGGFKIEDAGSDLTISPGRIYVDGILCQLEESTPIPITFPAGTNNQVQVPNWIVDHLPFEKYQWVELAADGIDWTKFRILDVNLNQRTLTLNTRDLTSFKRANNPILRRIITYATQPDYPNPEYIIPAGDNPPQLNLDNGNYLIYLDVWQRHITALDDDQIREVALGGADTATRTKTVWQVRILPFKETDETITCNTPIDFNPASTGKLNARTKPIDNPKEPCLIPPTAGYLRLENQLYRVEVHQSGKLGEATFKWSRDNGSFVTNIEKFDGNILSVHDVGRDEVLGFANNQWVEIVDDRTELNRQLGQLVQIDKIEIATRRITLKTAPTAVESKWHPKLRRWDSQNAIKLEVPASNDGWIALEGGIEVKFSDGYYNSGDYWMIPARTATGNIEWESDLPQPPLGIQHHYCRLAVVEFDDNTFKNIQDCRKHFPPLTELPTGAGCCTVTVGDGVRSVGDFSDIKEAIASLLQQQNGGKLCILPGNYVVRKTIVIEGGRNLIISGCDRQTLIRGIREQPVFQLDNCRNVTLESLQIEAASERGAIAVNSSQEFSLINSSIRNKASASSVWVQAKGVRILGNHLTGIWIQDGSANILIQDNEIARGTSAGIALGSIDNIEKISTKAAGISHIEIIGNHIHDISNSGISTVAHQKNDKVGIGDVENLTISHNQIVQCAAEKPNPFYDNQAVGGIILREVSQVRIHHNYIAENGLEKSLAACGIFVTDSQGLEIANNTVIDNGSVEESGEDCINFTILPTGSGPNPRVVQGVQFLVRNFNGTPLEQTQVNSTGLNCGFNTEIQLPSPVTSISLTLISSASPARIVAFNQDRSQAGTGETSGGTVTIAGAAINRVTIFAPQNEAGLLRFCFGTPTTFYQAGIVALNVIGGNLEAPNKRSFPRTGTPAASIQNNAVVCPKGHALIVTAIGPVLVSGNTLSSHGVYTQPNSIPPWDTLGRCVFISNLGLMPELYSPIPGDFIATNIHLERPFVTATTQRVLPDGRVQFHSNQVTLQITGKRDTQLDAPIAIVSLDDISFQDNQILTENISGVSFFGVVTLAPTIRASGNRFTELRGKTTFSYFSSAQFLNLTTDNQSTHCILTSANPGQKIETNNQEIATLIWKEKTCASARAQLKQE
ncbi:DUF6519 domain-containing protein [Microseira sp. BLCC-F43]|jgi:hypothetical protein|uniref:DUF6519 domain-containing protein n=1 Tax=Microseira sp. BLCC-F43 TaxID=3153602 RepID=UPI0035BB2E52